MLRPRRKPRNARAAVSEPSRKEERTAATPVSPLSKANPPALKVLDPEIGMRVENNTLDNWGPKFGTIIGIEIDACVIRLDKPRDTSDGDAANVAAIAWEDVLIANVRPREKTLPSSQVKIIAPGDRVTIDIGDGDGTGKDGVVAYALPECCVVKLDEPLKYGNSRYAAAEWHLITLRQAEEVAHAQ